MSKSSSGSSGANAPASEIGTILAQRYEVMRELGRGGMGVVYLCRDLVTGERVALKRLRKPEGDAQTRPEETWWFQQEARAVASLDHPCIVGARDFGTLDDGSPYLAMDLLPGRSVHEWMYITHMTWPIIWFLMDQSLAGLAHAHARGIIHGDLKPSNLMLDIPTSDRAPRAFLLDMGLAWLRRTGHDPRLDGGQAPKVMVHAGAGTVGWVAPEQIRKAVTLVGPSTDLYALACILYRVLVGKEVFEGEAQEVLRAHKRAPIPDYPLPPEVPTGVDTFIRRMLAKKPWDRYEFAAEARRDWWHLRPELPASWEAASLALGQEKASDKEARAVRAARSLAPGLLSLRPAPMIGRQPERERLLQEVQEMIHDPRPSLKLFVLVGDAGVGKSRVAEWLCEYVHEQGFMHPLRARYGRVPSPIDGITTAVSAHYNLEGADRVVIEQTLMGRWSVDVEDTEALTWVAATAEWLRPSVPGQFEPVGPTGKRFVLDRPELRWLVARRVFERISKDRPILLWLDDLFQASSTTFDMLTRLRKDNPSIRLLVIATARREALLSDIDIALRMEALRADWEGEAIEMEPLGAEETSTLLRATLPLHDEATERAANTSGGNPLFALQLLHAWSGGGYLRLEKGQYRVPEEALAGRAMTTTELWDERLRAVPTEQRIGAYAAAAVGDDIRGVVLKPLLSALGLDPHETLLSLTRAQILIASGADRFRWPHALLQEHLGGRLTERADAPAIYRLAANALEAHPTVGSRRIMKLRVGNLLRAGDDEMAASLMLKFTAESWNRSRDARAVLKDLEVISARVTGANEAEYNHWRAEALRHAGRVSEAREAAKKALAAWERTAQTAKAATTRRLLGHISSDLGAPGQGRDDVSDAMKTFEKLGDVKGLVGAMVVLGEIDYLLGEHARARETIRDCMRKAETIGDRLVKAQCLLLLALIETAAGRHEQASRYTLDARESFDSIGYRLGMAQSDVVLAHAEFRAFRYGSAKERALAARDAMMELQNPRGEAAALRLLAMLAVVADDTLGARGHALAAQEVYDRLKDAWGQLEARLLLAQADLLRGSAAARTVIEEADAFNPEEPEPRQHRHLAHAWLAHAEGRWADAASDIDLARAAYGRTNRTGDATPHILARFAKMLWVGGAVAKIENWRKTLEADASVSTSVRPPPGP